MRYQEVWSPRNRVSQVPTPSHSKYPAQIRVFYKPDHHPAAHFSSTILMDRV